MAFIRRCVGESLKRSVTPPGDASMGTDSLKLFNKTLADRLERNVRPDYMSVLLAKLPGPFFDFLITDGDHWERVGKFPGSNGIKREFFHHPSALRVQDVIVAQAVSCFQKAQPSFNYYGPSEYRNQNLDELLSNLTDWIARCRGCEKEADFRNLLDSYFLEEAQSAVRNWNEQWCIVRDELITRIVEISEIARKARRERRTLLVLGV